VCQHFTRRTHQNTLRSLHNPPYAKTQVRHNALLMKTAPGPPEHEKKCIDISRHICIGMHCVTQRSNRMQKHKFSVNYSGTLFKGTALSPPEHEKLCFNVSRLGSIVMHYVTHRSPCMQKHKFGITSTGLLFMESISVPPEHEK
jgi:hypothetical protein